MSDSWKAGMEDLDDQGLGPSAANPLTAAGLDPDMVRADPESPCVLERFSVQRRPSRKGNPPGTSPAEREPCTGTGRSGFNGRDTHRRHTLLARYERAQRTSTRRRQMANQAAEEVPTTDPKLAQMEAQRSKLAAPVDLYDSATGKMKAQAQVYNPDTGLDGSSINAKPSVGRRIWRGVRGGLVGLAYYRRNPWCCAWCYRSVVTGPGEVRRSYEALQRAEQRNTTALGSTDAGIKDEFATWKDAVDAAKAKSTELRTNATIGKDQSTSGADLIEAQAEQQRATNQSPAAKNTAAWIAERRVSDQNDARRSNEALAVKQAALHPERQGAGSART